MTKFKIQGIIGIFIAIICVSGFINHGDQNSLKNPRNHCIRFHVLANSDSPEDQLLKLKVRDQVIAAMASELEESKNIQETRNILKSNIDKIQKIAEGEVLKNQKDYRVSVELGDYMFPTKRYGNLVFPAGEYEALRIVIGDGYGQNWWCVMFPPLCFIDVKNGIVDEKTKQELKNLLTEEEYHLILSATNEKEIPIQLRSKIFEFLKASKRQLIRFASTF